MYGFRVCSSCSPCINFFHSPLLYSGVGGRPKIHYAGYGRLCSFIHVAALCSVVIIIVVISMLFSAVAAFKIIIVLLPRTVPILLTDKCQRSPIQILGSQCTGYCWLLAYPFARQAVRWGPFIIYGMQISLHLRSQNLNRPVCNDRYIDLGRNWFRSRPRISTISQ